MNIFTITLNSKDFYARPDTCLNKDGDEYFCPEGVTELAVSVFIYARAAKAGKCIASRFAERYYTSIGEGIQFSAPQLAASGSPQSWWMSRSLDNSTFLLNNEKPAGEMPETLREKINGAFENISRHVSVRTGDYIAVELEAGTRLNAGSASYKKGEKEIRLIW